MRYNNRTYPSAGGRDRLEPAAQATGPRQMRLFTALFLVGLLMPFAGVQAKLGVESKWQDQDSAVSIDGSAKEWLGSMTYIDKAGLYIGVRNDDDYLYLCLHSSNREIGVRAMFHGLKVALGDKLSVQFPAGMVGSGGPPPSPPDQDRRRGPEADELILDHSAMRKPQHLSVDNDFGVQARLELEPDFICELKVPLVKTESFPYAIEAEPGGQITVRVDTPTAERPEMGEPPGDFGDEMPGGGIGGGMPVGPGGGMAGGRPGGGRPGGMGPRSDEPEPIHFKVKVQLATDRGEAE
jgi:hypothetical protein